MDGSDFPASNIQWEKKYNWTEIAQIICKDDILTIDLKDNKLLQLNIEKNFAERFDVNEFNKFCRLQKDAS